MAVSRPPDEYYGIGFLTRCARSSKSEDAPNSTRSAIVSLEHELLISLIHVMFHPDVSLVRPRARRSRRGCSECHRIFARKPRSDRRTGGRETVVYPCCAKTAHNCPGPRGILPPVPRNKNFTHTVYFGESVWIPATGNTSHTYPIKLARCRPLHI